MSRTKEPEVIVEEVSPFPEGYTMNSWDGMKGPEQQLEQSRGYDQYSPPHEQQLLHEGTFYLRPEWKIQGMQLAWIMEKLMNQQKDENLEKAWNRGWRPVRKEECFWLHNADYPDFLSAGRDDDYVRKCGMMLMKMPNEMYERQQESHRRQGEEIRQQSNELTQYLGDQTGPVKPKMYENNTSYTPNYKHR